MKRKTVNRSLPPPVQRREGFFIPLQYPRQELLVALAHLLLLGRLRAASVMNCVVDGEKFQKNDGRVGRCHHILGKGVNIPILAEEGNVLGIKSCQKNKRRLNKCIRMEDREDESCRLSNCDGGNTHGNGDSGAGFASGRPSSLRSVPNPSCADRSQSARCRGQ